MLGWNRCHSAANCSPPQATRPLQADRKPNAIPRLRSGAAARWLCGSGSAPLRHGSVLLLGNSEHTHDSIFLISNRPHAPAPEPDVCTPTSPGGTRNQALLLTWCPSHYSWRENRSALLLPLRADRDRRHSKSIAATRQTASFKSLYQKRSGGQCPRFPRSSPRRSVSDTALTARV